jgi:hypothetical protein
MNVRERFVKDRHQIVEFKRMLTQAASSTWEDIQLSREWDATFPMLRDWAACRLKLIKLEFRSIVRLFSR